MTLEFPSINRSILIMKLKQPYIEWTKTLPDRSEMEIETPPTIEQLNEDSTAFLIPEIMDDTDFEVYIEHAWILLFEIQLAGWTTDEKLWPKKRTRKMFNEWFDCKCSSLAVDLWGKEPLDYAD